MSVFFQLAALIADNRACPTLSPAQTIAASRTLSLAETDSRDRRRSERVGRGVAGAAQQVPARRCAGLGTCESGG